MFLINSALVGEIVLQLSKCAVKQQLRLFKKCCVSVDMKETEEPQIVLLYYIIREQHANSK